MKLLPEYRGRRVRPWMRYMNVIFFTSFFVLLLIPVVLFLYFNFEVIYEGFLDLNKWTIGLSVILIIFVVAFSFYLTWFFRECTPFGKKLDRLGIISRFLFEHGFVYEKRKQGKNGGTTYRFPKIYMRQRKFDLDIAFEMAGNKFQDKFKKIGGDLETSLAMDYMETVDSAKFKTYTMAYSAFLNRIKVPDVEYVKGKGLKLMENFYWDFDSDPHMIVAGGTGGGKTVLLRTLILALARIGTVYICDPKEADFVTMAEMEAFKGRIVFDAKEIIDTFVKVHNIMGDRYKYMNKERVCHDDKELRTYWEYGLEPCFLFCDEYNSFKSVVDSMSIKDRDLFEVVLRGIVLKGRQAGVFFVPAMQKPSRLDLPSILQSSMMFRLVVGRLDDDGYNIMFEEVNRNKEFKFLKYVSGYRVYGRGYAAVKGEVAREFYSPVLEKGFSFYDHFAKLKRIKNQFDPSENKNVLPGVVDDDKGVSVVKEKLSNVVPVREKVEKKEGEGFMDDNLEEQHYDLTAASGVLGVSRPQLFKVLSLVESEGYHTFGRDANDKTLLFENDLDFLKSLYEYKEKSDLSWPKTIEKYFME
ncbi:FtsK/SpoIIIE domain-containing protein [Streptococcus sp. H31]|uniref:FtsK/SpoIIIE domain-containing protein n=1 Tax=Streptococcus huangxiaojuni TaxID=3237239 RepID=UPI0034A132E8